ncbi:MAG: molybdenum cofactor guanylyltransferase [Lentimicrobiaceae bacterium]|nr:molybdenum cofactor guanylyltransferase [Lentimicrobiaceae bacterium]MCO5265106.1 molybdenum cofactor guanylyltransferase [Lentimicrobium sp.]
MINKSQITGIVLAGGKSTRMGTDKGLMIFQGKPLVMYSIDLLSMFCGRILISSNNPEYAKFGYEIIADELPGAGPMAGIAACLSISSTELNLVLSCDMPFLNRAVIDKVLTYCNEFSFVVPLDSNERPEPLCALYKKSSFPVFNRLLQQKSFRMTGLFQYAPVKFIHPEEYTVQYKEGWFSNFNTKDDLKLLSEDDIDHNR